MARLKKESLAERMASAMQQDLENGVWTHSLPGYRVLAKRYGVSRPTCCDALLILQNKGYLAAPEPKKARRITYEKFTNQPLTNTHLLIIIDSANESANQPQNQNNNLVNSISSYWKSTGGTTTTASGEPKQLDKWIKQNNPTCILLVSPSDTWITAVENTTLPCYALAAALNQSSGIISTSHFPLPTFIASLIPDIIAKNHSRILLVTSDTSDQERMHHQIRLETSKTITALDQAAKIELNIESPENKTPEEWHSWWQKILIEKQPSLVIIDSVYECASLHSYCLRVGIRMPQDLSIIVTQHNPILAWLKPSPTSYKHENETLQYFQQWVEEGYPQGQIQTTLPTPVTGETYGDAPY